jgi:SET domain-containing protein 6
VAQSNIPEGEELFSIPRGLVLAVQNSELKTLLGQDVEQLGPWLSLMLVMLYEYLQGEKSKWAPYFRVLPSRFDTLMFWSPAELHELQASTIVEKIGREGAEQSILEMIAPVVRGNPALFPPAHGVASFDGDAGAAALLELAHVMGSLIMAYAFDIEKAEDDDDEGEAADDSYMTDDEEEQLPKGMVPLADLLNADADRNNVSLLHPIFDTAINLLSGPSIPRGRKFSHEGNQANPTRRGNLQRLRRNSARRPPPSVRLCNRKLRPIRRSRVVPEQHLPGCRSWKRRY